MGRHPSTGARAFHAAGRFSSTPPEEDRARIDFHPEGTVRLFPQILAAVELCLAVELVRREVQETVRRQGERVRPQRAGVMHQRLEWTPYFARRLTA